MMIVSSPRVGKRSSQVSLLGLAHRLDPEKSHRWALGFFRWAGKMPPVVGTVFASGRSDTLRLSGDPRLAISSTGWRNPIAIAAGFDKNASATQGLALAGFGAVEVGSITRKPRDGNPLPRVWRDSQYRGSIINRYGLPNDGVSVVAGRVAQLARERQNWRLLVNIAPTPDADNDVLETWKALQEGLGSSSHLDVTINFSCPNVGNSHISPDQIHAIISQIERPSGCRLYAKLSPDIPHDDLPSFLDALCDCRADGVILGNTTRMEYHGAPAGLSGKGLRDKALQNLHHAMNHLGDPYKLVIISCGGVRTVDDVWNRLAIGASGVQLYTGMVYHGPGLVYELLYGILERMHRKEIGQLQSIIGKGVESAMRP